MTHLVLSDGQWAINEPYFHGKNCDPGRTGRVPRLFIEAGDFQLLTEAQGQSGLAAF